MSWLGKILLGVLFPLSLHADVVHFNNIFSDEVFLGGVSCGSNPGQETVYTEPKTSAQTSSPQALDITCAQGGGDCLCYYLYSKVFPAGPGKSFFEVRTATQEGKSHPIWILRETADSRSIAVLASESKNGEIKFREPEPTAYLDEKLTQRIDLKDIHKVPETVLKKILSEEPRGLAQLSITIPPAGKGQIEFRRHNPDTPGKTISGEELYKLAVGHYNPDLKAGQSYDWKFTVYKKVGSQYLVGGGYRDAAADFANISDIESDMGLFAWIEIKNLKFKEEKISKPITTASIMSDHPLAIAVLQSVTTTKTIKNRSYTKLRIDLLMRDFVGPTGLELHPVRQKAQTLREIWIPTFDEKNRINFWLTRVPGC